MAKYQAYPEYKDAAVEWLDTIPLHWTTAPIKYMALGKESLFLDGDWIESKDISGDEIRYITTGNVGEGVYKEQGAGFISTEKFVELNCTEVFPGDILMSRLNAPIGRSCIVPDLQTRIVTSVDNVIFRPDSGYVKEFLVYLFSCVDYFAHTANLARGATMQRISRGLLGNVRVIVPTLAEQKAIANFLDHETAKIDTLIEHQQQLIQLLKEKRQAVISHAVTKGLNPNALMKDSGVEWLGEVPAHWDVKYIKHLSQVKRGASPRPIDDPKYFDDDGEYAWVRIADVSSAGMYLTSTTQRLSELGSSLSVKLDADQLFVSIAGTVGKPCLTISKACIHDGFVYFPSLSIKNKFLYYIFEAGEAYLGLGKMGTQLNLNTDTVGGIKIGVPSDEEIDKIIEFIEISNKKFDCLIERAVKSVSLMQERRTALISAAVTGKIDVRNWQAPQQ